MKSTLETDQVIRMITVASVTVVAVVAAVVSYSHMRQLGYSVGEAWRANLIPLSIDGLMVCASMVLVLRRLRKEKTSPLAWVAIGLGLTGSLAANIADITQGSLGAVLLAVAAPIALFMSFELLLQFFHRPSDEPAITALLDIAGREDAPEVSTPVIDESPQDQVITSVIKEVPEEIIEPPVRMITEVPRSTPRRLTRRSSVEMDIQEQRKRLRKLLDIDEKTPNAVLARELGISIPTVGRRKRELNELVSV